MLYQISVLYWVYFKSIQTPPAIYNRNGQKNGLRIVFTTNYHNWSPAQKFLLPENKLSVHS